MVRALIVAAALAVLAAACGGSKCMDLCSDKMPCTAPFTCVSSKCLIFTDAGPPSCN